MKRRWMSMLCAAAVLFGVNVTAFAAEPEITHLYTFGDSTLDIGQGKALTAEVVQRKDAPEGAYIKAEDGYYWQGRYSNGKVFTELLAEYLGVGITNYGVGGAKSGPDASGYTNWSSWLPGTGGIEQTKEFIQDQNGSIDPNALYLISIGTNDTYNLASDTAPNVAAQSAANIKEMVADLASAGGKRFVVILQGYKVESGMSEFSQAHQDATLQAMAEVEAELDIEILCIDFSALNQDIEKDMQKYGYKTLSYYMISDFVPAIGYSYHYLDNSALFGNAPEGYGVYEYDGFLGYDGDGFWTADEYYYYDEYHVTRTTHSHYFNFMKPLINDFLGIEDRTVEETVVNKEAASGDSWPNIPIAGLE